jgi:hypothetical protein
VIAFFAHGHFPHTGTFTDSKVPIDSSPNFPFFLSAQKAELAGSSDWKNRYPFDRPPHYLDYEEATSMFGNATL